MGSRAFMSPDMVEALRDEDTAEIDSFSLLLKTHSRVFALAKPPQFVIDIVRFGGVINYIKNGGTLALGLSESWKESADSAVKQQGVQLMMNYRCRRMIIVFVFTTPLTLRISSTH